MNNNIDNILKYNIYIIDYDMIIKFYPRSKVTYYEGILDFNQVGTLLRR